MAESSVKVKVLGLVAGRLVAWRYFSGTRVSAICLVKPRYGVAGEIRADKMTAEHRSG